MASTYQYGDKEYTKQQVIEYGRSHYPKLYWIKRGIGIGAIASAILVFIIIVVMGEIALKEIGREYASLYYGDARMIIYIVGASLDALLGVFLIISSFSRPTDEQCFIHGEKCLRQIAFDREHFRNNREEQ